MNEDKEDPKNGKQAGNLVYALADYKQLVIQYRTSYAELVRSRESWKAAALWLGAVSAACLVFCAYTYTAGRNQARQYAESISGVNLRLQSLAERFDAREQELKAARMELEAKSAQVQQLQKNLSTASKNQAEKLLKDAGEK